MKYDDVDYAKQRLDGTVVRIGKKPVYLIYRDDWMYEAISLASNKSTNIDIRKVDLNLQPVPLGYINYSNRAYYVSRKPIRKWKQGLHSDAVVAVTEGKKKHRMEARRIITSKNLAECIKGKYPSLKEAYTSVNEHKEWSMAFSRDFAIDRTVNEKDEMNLMYKNKKVGYVVDEGVNLDTHYLFLKEALAEAMK